MRPKFLIDENLTHDIVVGVRKRDPSIDILRVGDPGAPPKGTPDPAILDFCETEQRILVTNNRASMPAHITAHQAAGKHIWGILSTRTRRPPLGPIVEMLVIIAGASEAEEYIDVTGWIP